MSTHAASHHLYEAAKCMCTDDMERLLLKDHFNKHWQNGPDVCFKEMTDTLAFLSIMSVREALS